MISEEKEANPRTLAVKEETVKLLCILCTVKTNRFYIPGETNLVERLRKDAFDRGVFSTLTYLYKNLDKSGQFPSIKKMIKEKVLNVIELSDLMYHSSIVELLITNIKSDTFAQKDEQM